MAASILASKYSPVGLARINALMTGVLAIVCWYFYEEISTVDENAYMYVNLSIAIFVMILNSNVMPLPYRVFDMLKMDPGMFGSILAIDMGGYQMAMDLAADPELGRFAGIVISAIFGCTVVFTIPVGMGAMGEEDRPLFTRGILLGLSTMPAGILAGGLAAGISVGRILIFALPVLLLSALLAFGLWKKPVAVADGFRVFAEGIRRLAILGLMLGAVAYMTGWKLIADMAPLEEAMEVVCSIAIVMLGSMPLAELLQRILRKPFAWLGGKTGLNSVSMTALLIGMVSVVPALAMFPRMDRRGKIVNGAFLVCGASCFAAHLGFAVGVEPELVGALLAAKLLGGLLGALMALAATKNEKTAS